MQRLTCEPGYPGHAEERLEAEQALPEILTSLRLLGSPNLDPGTALGQPNVAPLVDNLRGKFADVAKLIPTLVVEEYISPRQAVAIQEVYHALGSVPDASLNQVNPD